MIVICLKKVLKGGDTVSTVIVLEYPSGKNGAFGTNFYAGTVRVKDFELLRLQKGVKKGTDERGETEKNM